MCILREKTECVRISDKDSRISYQGEWSLLDGDYANFARTLTGTCHAGSSMEIEFTGCGIAVVGNYDRDGGNAEVWLDGNFVQTVNTYCDTKTDRKTKKSIPETRNVIAACYDLEEKTHSLKIVADGDGWIRVDAVEIKQHQHII